MGPPASQVFFGLTQYDTDQAMFRVGDKLYTLKTGATKWAGGVLPNYDYPVYKLIPVETKPGGPALLSKFKAIFDQIKSTRR